MRLTSTLKEREHHVTIPNHNELRLGTLAEILDDVSGYLDLTREHLLQQLFD